MTSSQKNVIILGSSRGDGNTRKILDHFATGHTIPVFDLNDYEISYFDYAHKNSEDDFLPLMEKIVQYDQIIFATPVYWYSMSAVMKTFFDRISDLLKIRKDLGRQLRGKKMLLIACSSNEEKYEGFAMPFEMSAAYLGMEFCGFLHTWVEADGRISPTLQIALDDFAKKL